MPRRTLERKLECATSKRDQSHLLGKLRGQLHLIGLFLLNTSIPHDELHFFHFFWALKTVPKSNLE